MKNKVGITFIKITAIHAITMLVVMAIIWSSIYLYCFDFIKQQRIQYNRQVLSQISYELERFYSKANNILQTLCTEDKYSVYKLNENSETDSAFHKIKKQVDFDHNIERCIYANGLGEFVRSVVVMEQNKEVYFRGQGGNSNIGNLDMFYREDTDGEKIRVIGPVKERYLKKYDKNRDVVCLEKNAKRKAVLVIDLESLVPLLGSSFLSERSFFITDNENKVVTSDNMEAFVSCSKESGQYFDLQYDRNILITSVNLELFNWKLNVVDSKDIIFQDIYQLWMRMFLVILAGVMISMTFFVCSTRKVLFPIHLIKKFIHHIEMDSDTYLEVTSGEIGEISQMINTMKRKIKELTEKQYILEMKTTEARLQALQSQMNPHFLYNTLDNIYCIAQLEEIEPITVLAKRLSEMLRYSINTEKMFVTLREEIEYIHAYIEIINVRYENRILLSVDIPEELMKCYIFRLLVQPLVENACLHGILPSKQPTAEIKIIARRRAGDIEIIVENSGIILTDEELEKIDYNMKSVDKHGEVAKKGVGIALSNIKERLELFYGQGYGLHHERIEGYGTRVILSQKYSIHEDGCYGTKKQNESTKT